MTVIRYSLCESTHAVSMADWFIRVQIWHFIWKKCGSPTQGEIAQIMRSTRSKYHYAIRYVKKNEEMLRKNAMAIYLNLFQKIILETYGKKYIKFSPNVKLVLSVWTM